MHYNKVVISGINTAKLKTLSDEEKKRLLLLSRAGDVHARDELIEGNLRLVLSVVQKFANRNDNADDLFQVGAIGLIKAIDNFNVELDVKFSTYAVPMIIGEIRRYLRDNNSIRVSRSVRDLAYKSLKMKEELTKELSYEPSAMMIARALNEKQEDVIFSMEAITEPVSLFEPVYNDSGDSIYVMDQIKDSSSSEELWIESIALRDAMKALNEREKRIINMRFYDGKTQSEVASEIGISQAQVSRLEKSALEQIRRRI